MTTFIFLLLAGICLGIYFWNANLQQPSTGNYYRKKKLPSRVQVSEKNTEQKEGCIAGSKCDETHYDALGLKISRQPSLKNTEKFDDIPRNACVIVLYLMSEENLPFSGYELMQALLSAGLRFGDQRIFHRHTHNDGRGQVLFHCASAMSPGTFDLTKMGSTTCQGLSFFFSAADVDNPLFAFDCLLETLDQLTEDLGGKVFDDQHALLTTQKMLAYREQLRSFEAIAL